MTEAQRRVIDARIKVKGTILDPLDELFAAYEQHAAESELKDWPSCAKFRMK